MELSINYFQTAEAMHQQGLSLAEITQTLKQHGADDENLSQVIKYLKDLRYLKQRKIGFKCLAAGAVFCLSGCLLTFVHDYSTIYASITLYGMTLSGACLVLSGLAFVLGI